MARAADHVADMNEIRALVEAQCARFGIIPTFGGPWSVGDAGHLREHNAMRDDLAAIATATSTTLDLPPVRTLGDQGHPIDHDKIRAACVALAALNPVPAAPVLRHSAFGVWTIENYSAALAYTITAGSAAVAGNKVNATAGDTDVTVAAAYGTGPKSTALFSRRQYTFTQREYDQTYNPNGDLNTSVNPNTWTCPSGWTAGGGEWGVGVCRKYPGETVKNPTPAGYTDELGEWVK